MYFTIYYKSIFSKSETKDRFYLIPLTPISFDRTVSHTKKATPYFLRNCLKCYHMNLIYRPYVMSLFYTSPSPL